MSSAIVRYGARAALPYVRRAGNLKRVQMAAKAIQFAFRNRKSIKRAGTKIVRWVKRRKTTKYGKRMKAPMPKQRSAVSGYPTVQNSVDLPLASMNYQLVEYPNRDADNNLNTRTGIYIKLKGIKFCRQFEVLTVEGNGTAGEIRPIIMHYALVELKDSDLEPTLWGDQFRAKFFRSFNETNDRHTPFVDNQIGSGWSSIQNCLNMNPDGEFNIIWHKRRRMMQPTQLNDGTLNGNVKAGSYIWHFEKYIKFNKKISYTNLDSTVSQHPMFEIFWYQTLTPTNYPSGGNEIAAFVKTWAHHTVYYGKLNN